MTTNPWVRPYVLTGGRTRTRKHPLVHTLVSVDRYDPTAAAGLSPETRRLYERAAAGTQSVALAVRSGADVQLSGEDSYGGNISITNFSWQQTAGPSVTLLYRNSSTISFTAPAVSQSTSLTFQLSVTITSRWPLPGSTSRSIRGPPRPSGAMSG